MYIHSYEVIEIIASLFYFSRITSLIKISTRNNLGKLRSGSYPKLRLKFCRSLFVIPQIKMSGVKLPKTIKGVHNESSLANNSKAREEASTRLENSKALNRDGNNFSPMKSALQASSGRENPEWLRHDYVDVIRDIHRGKKHWHENDMNFTSTTFYNPRATCALCSYVSEPSLFRQKLPILRAKYSIGGLQLESEQIPPRLCLSNYPENRFCVEEELRKEKDNFEDWALFLDGHQCGLKEPLRSDGQFNNIHYKSSQMESSPHFELKKIQANGESFGYIELNPQLSANGTFLLVHGNLSAYSWWYELIALLPERHIVALDLRGYGNSTYNSPITSLQDFANDVKEFCSKKNLKDLIVVGWSLGGLITMKFAEVAPELVKHIVLVCSVGHLGLIAKETDGTEVKTMDQIKSNQKYKTFTEIIEKKEIEKMRGIFNLVLFKGLEHISEERKNELVQTSLVQRNYNETIFVVANPNIDLSKIKAHWTIVIGNDDVVTPLPCINVTIVDLQKLGQKVNTIHYGNGGHMVPIQFPEKLAIVLKQIQ